MKAEEIQDLFRQFESIVLDYEGVECWSARELYPLLGYNQWRSFSDAIERAKESCEAAAGDVQANFADVRKIVKTGVAEKEIEDILLSRYACYLVAQNGDPRKPQIAFAQTYFAVQTRRAEIVTQRLREYERVTARNKLKDTESRFSGILYERGIDSKGLGIIRSEGDQALFHLNTQQLKRKFGAPDYRPVADFMPTLAIKAKDFAAEMTNTNVVSKGLEGFKPIEKEHIDNNAAVRQMLIERGIQPEKLPAAEDVTKVERRLKSEQKKAIESGKKAKKKQLPKKSEKKDKE